MGVVECGGVGWVEDEHEGRPSTEGGQSFAEYMRKGMALRREMMVRMASSPKMKSQSEMPQRRLSLRTQASSPRERSTIST